MYHASCRYRSLWELPWSSGSGRRIRRRARGRHQKRRCGRSGGRRPSGFHRRSGSGSRHGAGPGCHCPRYRRVHYHSLRGWHGRQAKYRQPALRRQAQAAPAGSTATGRKPAAVREVLLPAPARMSVRHPAESMERCLKIRIDERQRWLRMKILHTRF